MVLDAGFGAGVGLVAFVFFFPPPSTSTLEPNAAPARAPTGPPTAAPNAPPASAPSGPSLTTSTDS